jgi:hypothetical protein
LNEPLHTSLYYTKPGSDIYIVGILGVALITMPIVT